MSVSCAFAGDCRRTAGGALGLPASPETRVGETQEIARNAAVLEAFSNRVSTGAYCVWRSPRWCSAVKSRRSERSASPREKVRFEEKSLSLSLKVRPYSSLKSLTLRFDHFWPRVDTGTRFFSRTQARGAARGRQFSARRFLSRYVLSFRPQRDISFS